VRFFEYQPRTAVVRVGGPDGVDVMRVELRDTELRLDSVYRYLYNTAAGALPQAGARQSYIHTYIHIRLLQVVKRNHT